MMGFNVFSVLLVLMCNYFSVNLSAPKWPNKINGILRGTHYSLQPALQDNLASGVQLALEHCQYQFKWDRWNCPENVFSKRSRRSYSTKEQAYVSAITSAAIVHVVTKNCSLGNIKGCGCHPDLNGQSEQDWIWSGCSDYPEYGENASKKYLDSMETGIDAQTYVNLHNYKVGRDIVKSTMKKHCKCHGMSGSCTVKSCWMQMTSFNEIATQLRKRYDHAVRVDFEGGEGKVVVGNSVTGSTLTQIPKADTDDLVYLEVSPNYCHANNTTDWKGTKGRSCSREKGEGTTPLERKSCRNLCKKCGHRVKKTKRTVTRHCNCSFKWCCEVKCELCTVTVVEHFCS